MRSIPPISYTALLTAHPKTNSKVVQGIEVYTAWSQSDILALSYTLTGDRSRVRIPAVRSQARVDGLWQHTCFEVFLSPKDDATYWEGNFSPSSEWAMYQFRSYRKRVSGEEIITPPQIVTRPTVDRFTVDVRLPLPHVLTTRPLRLGLSAVIEDDQGKLSYWALKHLAENPDFHHADAFALEIVPMAAVTRGKESQ